ncbi:MAG: DUF1565 domain-containing protein [bacterium]|nr:DUF1565 domain-containing protein [bacterium]
MKNYLVPGVMSLFLTTITVFGGCEIIDEQEQEPEKGYYVSLSGSDSNEGTFDEPFLTIKKGLSAAEGGETVYLREGTYDEKITFPKAGTAGGRITLSGYNGETVIVTNSTNPDSNYVMDITKAYISIKDIVFDGEWRSADIIKVRDSGDNLILSGLEVKNTKRDAVDMAAPENVLVENCIIHNALWFYENGSGALTRDDAHGLVTGGVNNLTIRSVEIYYVSGDALQFQYGGWNNITVENCHLWNGPLPQTLAAGAGFAELEGKNPGENAVDTKYYIADGRGKLVIKNVLAHGWYSEYMSNGAAFNIKHNVEVEFDGITTYDNDIAFRLRGPGSKGGAWVTLKNAVIYDTARAVRYEDAIENLHIYNSTFANNSKNFESAGGYGSGFEVKNNLFLNTKPAEAGDSSNLAADASAFVDMTSDDYHLSAGSPAIDYGISLAAVTVDRDRNVRPQGSGYDVGAYEYCE